MKNTSLLISASLASLFCACEIASQKQPKPITENAITNLENVGFSKVGAITPPSSFKRIEENRQSFAQFLRERPLKKDNTVYLYNGKIKANQQAQFAVMDISIGTKDLQQCADAIMRLRAEYLFAEKRYDQIKFSSGNGLWLVYDDWLKGTRYKVSGNRLVAVKGTPATNNHESLMNYLEFVFAYCGTSTLPTSLYKKSIMEMQPGDIFLKPGAPGHAVIVMDMVQNTNGEKAYLLAQSYMPAQNIHVLKNPATDNSPWYTLNNNEFIETPEWRFTKEQLYGWK